MKHCRARTKGGKICRAAAGPSGFCFMHDPERRVQQAAAHKAGGQARQTPHSDAPRPAGQIREMGDVLALLDYATAEALQGDNTIPRGRLLVVIAGAFVQAIQVGEFETRLAALEAKQAAMGSGEKR